MTVHLVTFSDESMSRSRELCAQSAHRWGVRYSHEVVATEPCRERGCGYWKWKPEIIYQALTASYLPTPKDGDTLIYSDAGVEFIDDVGHIINYMDQDIFLFGNNWEHAHWCKRDVIEAIFSKDALPDFTHWALPVPWEFFGKQCQASVIFFRVSDYSRKFVKEWLDWCLFEGGRLIDDSPSRAPNHPEFREHRHDQAILTTMAYREGLKLHWWPSVYNRWVGPEFVYEKLPCYSEDSYPVLFHHHRLRNHEFEAIRPSAESAVSV